MRKPETFIPRPTHCASGGKGTDRLDLLSNRENRAVLAALTTGPGYPRRLAERLSRSESEVSRRLRALEQAGLVEGRWAREHGRNVRLYHLTARRFEVVLEAAGYRIETPAPPEVPRSRPPVQPVPVRRPLFGREEELARLRNPETRLFVVVGIAGMGKTSLGVELAHRAGAPVFWHSCTPFDTAMGFLETVARWLVSASSPVVRMFERPGLDLAAALDEITARLARSPTLLILDDFHRVRDEGVVEIVRGWHREVEKGSIVVLSRTRPPFGVDATTQLITLAGLRPEASRALLQSRGLRVTEEELAKLQRRFGGHPLALLLSQHGSEGTSEGSALLRDLGPSIAASLAPDVRTVLLALAAVRRPLPLPALRVLTHQDDPGLPLTVLERQGLVREIANGWAVHEVVREALRPLLDARPELDRRALDLFLGGSEPEDFLEALWHAMRAGKTDTALRLLESDLLGEGQGTIGKGYSGPYLDVLDRIGTDALPPRGKALVLYARGRIMDALGRRREAIRSLTEARRVSEASQDSKLMGLALRQLGSTFLAMGRPSAAERALRRYLGTVEKEGWDARRADALWRLHAVFHRRGEMGEARRLYRAAVQEARRQGNRGLLLEISTFCSMAWPRDWRKVMPTLRRRASVYRRLGEPGQVASVHAYLGEIACRQARWTGARGIAHAERALVNLDHAIRGFDTLGDAEGAANARSWRALAFLQLGRQAEALAEAEAVLRMGRVLGPDHSAILGHQVLAELHRRQGDLARAQAEAEAAVRTARAFDCRCTGQALLQMAIVQEARRGAASARRMLLAAVQDASRRGYPDEAKYARREARRRHWPIARTSTQ